jgi:hypothetical protein
LPVDSINGPLLVSFFSIINCQPSHHGGASP